MKTGALLQILSLEMSLGCNLSSIHPQCPNSLKAARYAALPQAHHLTDDIILDTIATFWRDHGFRGWVNFSFYNEPMLEYGRLLNLARRTRSVDPELRLMLITNGMSLPIDVQPLKVFDWISITDYGDSETPDPARLRALQDLCGVGRWTPDPRGVFVNTGKLDRRLRGSGGDRSERPCVYPFKDLAIDYFGNCHVCCYDWRGLAHIGNVITDGIPACLSQWERVVKSIAGHHMDPDAPLSCRTCQYRGFQRLENLNMDAKRAAQAWLGQLRETCGAMAPKEQA